MIDKKQVMFDIERCICHVPDACRDCSKYKGIDGLRCMEELMADAYTLLKEQEAQFVQNIAQQISCFSGTCPKCGKMLNTTCNKNFCGECGQAVKWND